MKLTLISMVMASLLVVSPAAASSSPCAVCELEVQEVRPHIETVRAGKVEHQRVRGAVLRVAPRPGLTAAWLRHAIAQGRVSLAKSGECPLPLAQAGVFVRERGAYFEIGLVASDREDARRLIERAEKLVER